MRAPIAVMAVGAFFRPSPLNFIVFMRYTYR